MKRSRTDRIIGGVCGGIADDYGSESWIVRFMYLWLIFITFIVPGVIIYLIAWMIIPKENNGKKQNNKKNEKK